MNLLLNPDVPGTALSMFYLGGDPAQVCNAGGPQALDEVRLREGSLLWPKFPAPLGMRGLTLMRFLAAVNGLINVAGGKAPAAHSAYVISFMRGTYRDDRGQARAVPDVRRHRRRLGRARRPPTAPTRSISWRRRTIRSSSSRSAIRCGCGPTASSPIPAAPGRCRGGCGIVREYDILAEEAMLAIRIDSVKNPPWGIAGGMAGGTGRVVVNPGTNHERVLQPLSRRQRAEAGDVLRIETGGGGGYGHPFDRPAETVLEDVLGGFVSAEAARGSTASPSPTSAIDRGRARRSCAPSARPRGAFHRHAYVDSLA